MREAGGCDLARFARRDPLDDAELRALEPLDPESFGANVGQWFPHQVVALEAYCEEVEKALYCPHRSERTTHVLH